MITLDTFRADRISAYGNSPVATPHLDEIARNGVLFETVISHIPLTLPSHTSIFTGTYPQYHGVRDNGGYSASDALLTLAEILKERGYTTAAFVSSFVLDSKFGLDQGFDTYADDMPKAYKKKVIKHMEGEKKAGQITEAAIEWIQESHGQPFFLWLHYYDPHSIYEPPPPYSEQYKDRLYDGEIAYVDAEIGKLMNTVNASGFQDHTIVVVVGDHGEGLGEHDEEGHAVFIYDTTLKVPLMISYPKKIKSGIKIPDQVRLVDILPTLLEYLKIGIPGEVQGESLKDYIRGKKGLSSRPAYSESLYAHHYFNWSPLKSWRTDEWKYIQTTEPELFNLKEDPSENHNLAYDFPDIVSSLDGELERFLEETSGESASDGRAPIDEETRQKLMSLGYLAGSSVDAGSGPVPRHMVLILQKMDLASRIINEGRIEKAITLLKEVLEEDPNNMRANLHLGRAYQELEQYDDAILYFKKATASQADKAEAHDGLGNIYKTMGKADLAYEEFKIAHAMDPENAHILNNLGWCYQQNMQFDKALEYYDQALSLDPDVATARANRAIIYRVQKKYESAMEELDRAIALEPDLAFAYAALCAVTAVTGNLEGAIPHCKKAIELDPEGIDGFNNLGVCYERLGKFKEALEQYKLAAEIQPWNAMLYFHMGNAFAALGNKAEALKYYDKTLQLDPGHAAAKASRYRLENEVSTSKFPSISVHSMLKYESAWV